MVIREEILRDIITFEDGFKYWWPEGYRFGAFSSQFLRELADYLDEQNKEWNELLEKDPLIADPRES